MERLMILQEKNIASEQSFREAIFLGLDVIRNRQNFEDMTANPLKKISRGKQPHSDKKVEASEKPIGTDNDDTNKNNPH